MSIRLNKALRELNIGLQTAVDFLKSKKELGEVKEDLSFKLNDAQYKALESQFRQDAEVRSQAEKLFQKKPKEKKRVQETKKEPHVSRIADVLEESGHQKYTPLGKIELNPVGRKPVVPSVAPKQKDASRQKREEDTAVSQQPVKPMPKTKPEDATPVKKNPVTEAKSVNQPRPKTAEVPHGARPVRADRTDRVPRQPMRKPEYPQSHTSGQPVQRAQNQNPVQQKAPQPTSQEAPAQKQADRPSHSQPEVFTLKSERKLTLNEPKVLGKIDLSALNQSTRPKRKSKEEKRKERESKLNHDNGERKKRVRINKERVDINAEARQQQQQGSNGSNRKRSRNRRRNQKPLEVNEEDVARQVKETLARLTNKQNQNKKGAKYRKEKRVAVQEKLEKVASAEKKDSKVLKLTEFVTVSELASMMDVPVTKVISTLMSVGMMVSINERLDAETINMVAEEFGFKTEYISASVQEAVTEKVDKTEDLKPRQPIVTVMGHVDHGKTSLLDYIRKTNVIAGEAGGITQHISAYDVRLKNGRHITFLDTPGHEAFTAMRARGTQVTDVAIIIIAADDSVMPTTREAIAHCQASGVPMVFAINKIDKPGANPDKIRTDLSNMNLLVEDWGGKYQCQEISAKKGVGVDELLDKVLLEADMLDLKANPNRKATGTVIESALDKGRGYVATVLVSNGTLKVGDVILAGTSWGRVKAMFNERNQSMDSAGPAVPTTVLGLDGAPAAGDQFHVIDSEQDARVIANKREQLQREQGLRTQKRLTLGDISRRIARGEFHELNIIVKGDTDGSIEALSDSFIKLSTPKVQVNVIEKGVGQITENDVMMASASDAIIVGFQVRPSVDARKLAEREGVEINTYSVIYNAIDDIKSAMVGMLDKVKKEVVTGQIEVKQVFKISKVGTIAGGLVTEGKIHAKDKARVVRNGIVIKTASINELKRFKDDVKEVPTGMECGLSLVNFNDIQVGDEIETFTEVEVDQKL